MDPITIILLIVVGYLLLQSGGLSNLGIGGSSSYSVQPPPQGTTVAAQPFNAVPETLAAKAATAIPVVGGFISSIIGSFTAASQQRAAQARDENSAIAVAVPQWDQMVSQIVAAYNRGQVTNADVQKGLYASMDLYWSIVQPHVQPGRDGCLPGGVPVTQAQQLKSNPGMKACGGSWGGGCCVAYADLWASIANMLTAVNQNWNTGKPAPAVVVATYASKYGGIARPQYTVTFAKP